MASEEAPREERTRVTTRQWTGPERRNRFAAGAGGQLLERGEGAADPMGSLGDESDIFSTEGERGTNIGGRCGGAGGGGGAGSARWASPSGSSSPCG